MSDEPPTRETTERPEGEAHRPAEPAADAESLSVADLIELVEREGPLELERVSRIIEGIATALESHGSQTEDALLQGIDYVAPERLSGGPVDHRADVYSLAGLAFLLLTGAEPFTGQGPAERREAHLSAARPRPSRVRASVPMAVDRVIARGMAIDPANRYETAGEFARALDQALGGHTRRRALIGTGLILAALGAISAAIMITAPEPRDRPPELAIRVTQTATGAGPVAIASGGGRVWVANRADGTITGIDPRQRRPERSIDLGEDAKPVAIEAAFDSVWVVDRASDALLRLDAREESPPVAIPVGAEPADVVASRKALWIAVAGERALVRVDPAANAVDATVQLTGAPKSVAFADGRVWAVSPEEGLLHRVDARAAAARGTVELQGRPNDLAIAHGMVWVSDIEGGAVRAVDAKTLAVAGEPIEVGPRPRGIAAGTRWLWVAIAGEDSVVRIDGPRARVRGRPVKVGREPADVTLGFDSGWTANLEAATASRIRYPDRPRP